MNLDLKTLRYIKLTFDLHSDHSTKCNGYNSLCRIIEQQESIIISTQYDIKTPICNCDGIHGRFRYGNNNWQCSTCGKDKK